MASENNGEKVGETQSSSSPNFENMSASKFFKLKKMSSINKNIEEVPQVSNP